MCVGAQWDQPENTQQLRDNIGSALEGKVEARTLTQHTRMEVLDLDEMATAEDLQKVFKDQLGVSLESCDIKSLRPAFGGTQRAIISLPASLATKVLKVGKVKIAWSVCRIRERNLPARCYKCLEFGHIAANCGSVVDRSGWCFRCGTGGHKIRECHKEAKCFFCAGNGQPHNHIAGSLRCPMASKAPAKVNNTKNV